MKLNPTRAALAVFAIALAAPFPALAQMGAGDPVPAPAGDPMAAPAAPTFQTTLSTAEVTELQTLLAQAGFDPGAADGVFGPATHAALMAYQQNAGLTADGEATLDLLQTMRTSVVGAAPAPGGAPADLSPGPLGGGLAPAPAP
jgi:peptidoglycan hydrolase-like protein with peptidoglycan-binding domain